MADKILGGKTSRKEAAARLDSYFSEIKDRKLSRRVFGAALGTLSLYLASCGGNGDNNYKPPPPPPEQTYDFSGSVSKRIASDGSKIGKGTAKLEGTKGTFSGNIDASGNFKITGVKAGTYKLTINGDASDTDYVTHVESTIDINNNMAGQNYSVIERGPNRFNFEFTPTVQDEYAHMIQHTPGQVWKWTDLPTKDMVDDSTVPVQYQGDIFNTFMDMLRTVVNEDTSIYFGGRLQTLPVELGKDTEYTIGHIFYDGPTSTTFPLVGDNVYKQVRVQYNSDLILGGVGRGIDVKGVISHERGHVAGAGHFDGPDASVMNVSGNYCARPQDSLLDPPAHFLLNHAGTKPGNYAPDTNP